MILLLYVDDPFFTGEDEFIVDAKRIISTQFDMKYLGVIH